MTSTDFSEAYKTNNLVCYICGCNCAVIGSRGHEVPCLRDWLQEHPGNEDYAPIQPENYPDPFTETQKDILNYNKKATDCANACYANAPGAVIKDIDKKKQKSFSVEFEKEVIPPQKFIHFDDQDEAQRKKFASKYQIKVSPKKFIEKTPKVFKHNDLVEIMEEKANHVPTIPDPGRIPKGHEYAYTLDEIHSKNEIILQPCFLATEELKKMGLPSYAGSASRKNVVITPNVATL